MRKSKILIGLVFILLTPSCSMFKFYSGVYDIPLTKVEYPTTQNGEYKITTINADSAKYNFTDKKIDITWYVQRTQFNFHLINKTNSSLKILWDESVYVDPSGESQKIMHAGVKYIDRNNSQPATIVARGSKIDDVIIPTGNIYYASGEYGGWRELPLITNSSENKEKTISIANSYIGKIMKIILALELEGKRTDYEFNFEVKKFTPSWDITQK